MSLISSVAPNGVAGGPQSNVLPIALLQAQGAAGANPTAKLLLPNAVTAPPIVPAHAPETPKNPQRATLKLISTSQPSSTLAAQWIAQSPELSHEEIELFTQRQPLQPDVPKLPNFAEEANLKLPAPAAPAPQLAASTSTTATLAALANATAQGTPVVTAVVKENIPSENRANNAPAPVSAKRPGTSARGAQGYQFTAHATKAFFTDRAVEAVA